MDVQLKDLLEAGAHFGHQTRRWNPKMKPYIFKEQNGIYIIDLRKTLDHLDTACSFLTGLAAEGKTMVFVGTKRQAKESVREDAERCEMFYVNERWLGGTLTNFRTIKHSMDRLDDLEAMEKDGRIEQFSKKERLDLEKLHAKLLKVLAGIRGMNKLPSCLVVFDTKKEAIAIREARKLGIPVIALVDTNSDPDDAEFPIPANDDAIRSVKLFTKVFADAIIEGRSQFMKNKDFLDKKEKAAKGGGPKPKRPAGGDASPKAPRAPQAPQAPKAPSEPKAPQAPKAPSEPKAPKAPGGDAPDSNRK